ncbi:hypothetical protein [Streptomyces sp. CBMA29]|uniref:hypothetical protein n=1 Tax=Streptomyces sp. CBMA29 TaxID=1896314 RepID=UPI001661E307|nr:hypothetical protein [Streptomyces sp. CBMA29]MBD0739242.1 hypothetical protein [Streptomyces sp. CBMA29]
MLALADLDPGDLVVGGGHPHQPPRGRIQAQRLPDQLVDLVLPHRRGVVAVPDTEQHHPLERHAGEADRGQHEALQHLRAIGHGQLAGQPSTRSTRSRAPPSRAYGRPSRPRAQKTSGVVPVPGW